MELFGYTLVKNNELARLNIIEEHARGLLSEIDNPVPCCVMKELHKKKLYRYLKCSL